MAVQPLWFHGVLDETCERSKHLHHRFHKRLKIFKSFLCVHATLAPDCSRCVENRDGCDFLLPELSII